MAVEAACGSESRTLLAGTGATAPMENLVKFECRRHLKDTGDRVKIQPLNDTFVCIQTFYLFLCFENNINR